MHIVAMSVNYMCPVVTTAVIPMYLIFFEKYVFLDFGASVVYLVYVLEKKKLHICALIVWKL